MKYNYCSHLDRCKHHGQINYGICNDCVHYYLGTVDYFDGPTYKVWKPELTNILEGAKIGDNTTIGAFTEIGKDVVIGRDCKIQAFVFIPKGVTIGDKVFIGPSVTFTNDRYPSSTEYGKFEATVVGDGANIGAGSTIRCGITIGSGATIGAGSVVTKDVPPNTTVYGNPAKKRV